MVSRYRLLIFFVLFLSLFALGGNKSPDLLYNRIITPDEYAKEEMQNIFDKLQLQINKLKKNNTLLLLTVDRLSTRVATLEGE